MQSIQVAIVDDQRLFRDGLLSILNSIEGIEVGLEAKNGQDLLDQIDGKDLDVILLDMEMPVLDGFKTTKILKEKYPDIKVLLLSMHNDEHLIARMMKIGASGYLLKDMAADELKPAILQVQTTGFFFSEAVVKALLHQVQNPEDKPFPFPTEVRLTPRELEVLQLICQQKTTREIGEALYLATATIEGHRKNLLSKTGMRNVAGLVLFAIRSGIVKP
ncbi:MAG: response regulator transcription factor [Bacteroidota bacterium]